MIDDFGQQKMVIMFLYYTIKQARISLVPAWCRHVYSFCRNDQGCYWTYHVSSCQKEQVDHVMRSRLTTFLMSIYTMVFLCSTSTHRSTIGEVKGSTDYITSLSALLYDGIGKTNHCEDNKLH